MVAVKVNETVGTRRKHSPLLHFCSNRKVLGISILIMLFVSKSIYDHMDDEQQKRRKEVLVGMCDQRARMLQDQFSVSVNHVHALAILVSTFHYYKSPSAIDQVCLHFGNSLPFLIVWFWLILLLVMLMYEISLVWSDILLLSSEN